METVALVVVKLSVHGCYALGAPVLLGLFDVSYNTYFHPIAFCFITEQVSTLRMSILVLSALGAWPWINCFSKTQRWKYMISMQSHEFSYNLGIIALTTGINCTCYHSCNYFARCSCNYSQIALEFM